MAPLVSLLSDFGTEDGFVGAMKGRLLRLCPQAHIIDLTHEIPRQDVRAAAVALSRAVPEFPHRSIHVAVVDPGVGSERKGIAIETEIGWLVGPDNGIFSLLLRRFHAQQVRSITPSGPWWQKHSSFDGLHVFAPVAAWLAAEQSPEALGETLAAPQTLAWPDPGREGEWVRGEIVSFDHFGNATSNIPSDWLLPNPSFAGTIRCGRHKNVPLLSHFAAGNPHQLMAMLNSDGLLEFAVNQGSARELGVQLGTQIEVHLQSKTSP